MNTLDLGLSRGSILSGVFVKGVRNRRALFPSWDKVGGVSHMVIWWNGAPAPARPVAMNRKQRRRSKAARSPKTKLLQFETLEPRLLLSADPLGVSITSSAPTAYEVGAIYSDLA